MKLKQKAKRFLVALLIIMTVFVQCVAPLPVHTAFAEASEEKPEATVKQKILFVGYRNYTIAFKNLDKGAIVTYSSSDSKVASVSIKGIVKPVRAGIALITATIKQGGKTYTLKIDITVKIPYVLITNKTSEMKEGSSFTFTGKAYGITGADLTWSSSDTTVAGIGKTSGVLKAKAAGITFITLNDTNTGKKSVVTVKVTKGESEVTPIPETDTASTYKAPEGSDKAVYLSGLDLRKKTGTYYTTKKEEYINTTRFALYLDEGVKIPVNVIDLINHIMDMIEDETGYMFYVKQYQNYNDFNIDNSIDEYFDRASDFKKVNSSHDRINIAVTDKAQVAQALYSGGVLLLPEDINLLDGTEYAIIHELLHAVWFRNGCYMGHILAEGFTTYYSTLITQKDTVMNGVFDGYDQLQNLTEMISEAKAESLFTDTNGGWNGYKLGFRMMTFIMETYGAEAYRNMHDELTMEYSNPTNEDVAAALKIYLSEDFFQAFVLWHQKNLTRFSDKDLLSIGDWLITFGYLEKYYGNDKNVIIPDTVTFIMEDAFSDNKSIETVKIPKTVVEIGPTAFYDCDNLKEITIPDSVTSIGYCAFEECNNLKKVVLPKNITVIEVRTFLGCVSLESIIIPEGVIKIAGSAFQFCSSLTKLVIPDTVESIEDYAFVGCTGLKSVTIPESVKNIGTEAFGNCGKLTIYGKKGSNAESYAKENNIKFVAR